MLCWSLSKLKRDASSTAFLITRQVDITLGGPWFFILMSGYSWRRIFLQSFPYNLQSSLA